jgi:hypothetical protein
MFDDFIRNVLEPLEAGLTLLDKSLVAAYLSSDKVQNLINYFDSDTQTPKETGSFYDGVRTRLVDKKDDWISAIVAPVAEKNIITSSSSFSLVCVIDMVENIYLDRYLISNFPCEDDIPGTHTLKLIDSRKMKVGDIFVIEAGEVATSMRGHLQGTKFFRMDGPIRKPLVLSFDINTHLIQSVSFSTAKQTGDHFFVSVIDALIGELSKSGETPDIDFSESICRFLEEELESPIHIFTKWKMNQILAKYKPKVALKFLERLSKMDNSNASIAANKALQKIFSLSSIIR